MRIQDFTDMDKFHEIMKNWAKATGLATVAVDMDGNYISDCFNFADFCIKYTNLNDYSCLYCTTRPTKCQ